MTKTPPRNSATKGESAAAAAETPSNNNYAAPHTPIASIKRPRSSLERAGSSRRGSSSRQLETTHEQDDTGIKSPEATLSPLHPPKPLETLPTSTTSSYFSTKTVTDALFSPISHLWKTKEDDDDDDDEEKKSEHAAVLVVTDDDVCMQEQQNDSTEATNETHHPNDVLDAIMKSPSAAAQVGSPASSVASSARSPTHLTIKPSEDLSEFDYPNFLSNKSGEGDSISSEEEEDEFNPYLFIKSLPPYSSVSMYRPKPALEKLQQDNSYKLTLVLDLDETLVHCQVDPPSDGQSDLIFPVVFHGVEYTVYVKLRPYLMEFLEKLSKCDYEVIVFTASQKVYAEELLKRIDPESKYIHHTLFRESCLAVEGNFLKDLTVLNRDLAHTVLVDNSPHAFGYQMDNGIPIESWFEDPNDMELLKLEKFLRSLVDANDVRTILRKKFKTQERVKNA